MDCARPSTRWRRRFRVHHVLARRRTQPRRAACDAARGFDNYVAQVDAALDRRGVERAAICGISFGGLIAAALRGAPSRTRRAALVLVVDAGTAAGSLTAAARDLRCARRGSSARCSSPRRRCGCAARSRAAIPDAPARRRVRAAAAAARSLGAPVSLPRMAARARLIAERRRRRRLRADHRADAGRHRRAPLSITSCRSTARSRYLRADRRRAHAVLERTGHLGSITRPDAFADAAFATFVDRRRIVRHAAA